MKQLSYWALRAATAAFFVSCQSYRMIDVEIYHPAPVTFPQEAETVMIVNNSVQQPDNIGHRFLYGTKSDSMLLLSVDSAAAVFCLSLGQETGQTTVFQDVRICQDTLRHDTLFYKSMPFTPVEALLLCQKYDIDALISLDRLVFHSTCLGTYYGYVFKTYVSGELRALWPDQQEAYTVPFSDSLYFHYETPYDGYQPVERQELEMALRDMAFRVGRKMAVHFVPHWYSDRRWYYTSIISEWKRGIIAVETKQWDEAAEIWQKLLSQTKNRKRQTGLYSNLALCSEMKGDFTQAIEYAEQAYNIIKEYEGEESPSVARQKNYLDILRKRSESDSILARQLRESF